MPEILVVESYRTLAELAVGRTIVEVQAPDPWYVKGGATPGDIAEDPQIELLEDPPPEVGILTDEEPIAHREQGRAPNLADQGEPTNDEGGVEICPRPRIPRSDVDQALVETVAWYRTVYQGGLAEAVPPPRIYACMSSLT